MSNTELIIIIIISVIVVLILINAYYSKSNKKSTHHIKNNNFQRKYSNQYERKVKTKPEYKFDQSYIPKTYLDEILKSKIKILNLAITENRKVTFNYLISDRERTVNYNITPQRIVDNKYLKGIVEVGTEKKFKIELMKNIK
jgi:predicted DNA-binding transcriptional regulator YafY